MQIEARIFIFDEPIKTAVAKANVRVMFDDHYIAINDIWLRKSDQNDELYCNFPSTMRKDKYGVKKYNNVIYVDENLRKAITSAVVKKYEWSAAQPLITTKPTTPEEVLGNPEPDEPPADEDVWDLDL